MGIIFSRFRKKKSTLDVLEGLEKDIRAIEEFHRSTEQQHRKVMGHLMLYAVGLYVLVAFFFYFFFFPATLHEQILYLLPLLAMPILFVFVRRVITWYFRRKLTRNEEKLKDMKEQKKQLLDEVMEKETYKVARQILEKYAPDQLRKGAGSSTVTPFPRPGVDNVLVPAGKPVLVPSVSPRGPMVPTGSELRRRPINPMGSPPGLTPGPISSNNNRIPSGPPMMAARSITPIPVPLPRPILPHDRTVMDRLVEYLVGDGPSNRYALICQKCASHNGMALKEEFEYFAFRCCYCHHFNPARKMRPQAPRLEAPSPPSTSTSEAESPPTSSEEEESTMRPNDTPSGFPSQPSGEQRGSVDSASTGEEERSSQTPTDAASAPSEAAPCPGNPFDLSDEDGGGKEGKDENRGSNEDRRADENGVGDLLTSSTDHLASPPLVSSPRTEGIPAPPTATSTPTADSCT